MLLRGRRWRGRAGDAGRPRRDNYDDEPYVGINARPSSPSLPSSDEFYDPGLAFRREEDEDEDDDGDDSLGRYEGKETMTTTATMTTATLAVDGVTSKDDETVTSSRAAVSTMAPPNISSAPPRPSLADILRERRDMARKLSSRGDDDNDDDVANDDGTMDPTYWF